MIKLQFLLVLFTLMIASSNIFAKDFGMHSTMFPIKEEGFIEMIMRKLQSVDIEAANEKLKQSAKDKIENPESITSVIPAKNTREFLVDPSFTLKEDIILPCGKVLYKAGTKVNPLDHMDLDRRVFFIDGRRQEQIEWLKKQLKQQPNALETIENRIILVGGSPLKLQNELRHPVYFDQTGEIVTKFGIKASPVIMEQQGKMLKVTEIKIGVK